MRKAQYQVGTWTAFLARVACAILLLAGSGVANAAANKPPTVTLTSPTDGASFFASATIGLAANASDSDGSVVRVDFFQGTTLIGTSTTPPYTATWSNVAIGSYTLTAKATDNKGAAATSAPVSITVNSATALVINTPASDAAVNISAGVAVSGTFEGTADSTIFVDDGNSSVLATISGNSFAATVPAAIGATTITAKLSRTDNTSASRSISVMGYSVPGVAFTAPSSSTFLAPATVTFAVDAKAPGGSVTKVDFFNGSTLVGTVPKPPYQITLSNLAKGTYTISAKATSDQGPVGSASDTIVVQGPNVPPSISITSPAAGATFNAPATIPITVNATDSDGTVTLVGIFANGTLISASSVAPFGFTWSNVGAGSYALTASATDNSGAQTTSAPVSITVNNPPMAMLTSPVQGASFSAPSTVTLTANATDTDGTIARVEFYQGTTLIGASTTAPYAVSWSVIAPGTYTLTAKAFDNQGASGVSAPVTVTVSGSITYLHNDFAGNPIAATDANGNLLWKENFRPYGDRLNNQAAAAGNRQWFAGKPADADTGLSYFGARYYDPTLGRFMGVDTEGFNEKSLHTFNRYAYGNNNPYKYIDIDGRFSILEIGVVAAILGVGGYIITNSPQPVLPGKKADTDAAGSNLLTTPGVSESGGQLPGFSQLLEKLGNLIFSEKQSGGAFPDRPLPRDPKTGKPVPETDAPHTQLGTRGTGERKYPQAREFGEQGKHVRDIDFTDHGMPDTHPNPHQHRIDPQTGKRGGPEPLQ